MYTRADLDAEMRGVLAQLSTCSHVPASGYQPTGRSRSSDEPLGGSRPPGDIGEAKYARMYGPPFHEPTRRHPGADSDQRRREVIDDARGELERIRGRGISERPAGETQDDVLRRMLTEAEGWTPEEIEASSFRISARLVRKHRVKASLDPETGKPLEAGPGRQRGDAGRFESVDAEARAERARRLDDEGFSLKQIALLLRVSRSTVERDLGRRRAA